MLGYNRQMRRLYPSKNSSSAFLFAGLALAGLAAFLIWLFSARPAGAVSGMQSFVQRSGDHLILDGQPYRFLGFNRDNAASDATFYPGTSVQHYACGAGGEAPNAYLAQMFSDITSSCMPPGANVVVRIWAFQNYAVNRLTGQLDFSQIDRVVDFARRYHVRLIMTLDNQWDDCTLGGQKTNAWYQSGYRLWNQDNTIQYQHRYSYPFTYRDYVGEIVRRYRDDPTILAWELMNEAESETVSKAADPASLYLFVQEMAGWIKSIDPNHLVTPGMDSGQSGTTAGNYTWIHSIPEVDLITSHEYTQEQVLPDNFLRDLNTARVLEKPAFAGEVGIPYPDPSGTIQSLDQRAQLFRQKMDAYFRGGGSGYLFWSWINQRDPASPDHSLLDIDANDPVCSMLRSYSPPPCETCSLYSTQSLINDWETGSTEGWVKEYGPLAALMVLPGQAKTGSHALMLTGILEAWDGWDELRIYTRFPAVQNWARLGTDLVAYIYLPASSDGSITGDLRATFLINGVGGPPNGLTPGLWNRVEWVNAPLQAVGEVELKISTSTMAYAGPLFLDSLHVSRKVQVETIVPLRRFPNPLR